MYISIEQIEFFIVLVIAGSLYGWYCYNKGIDAGVDDILTFLEDNQIISIDPDTGEISRF